MASWLPFALLAPALMTLVNFGDKYVVERQIPDPGAVLIYLALVNSGLSGVLWAVTGFPILAPLDAFLLITAGVLVVWGNVFYFRAVSTEETSRIIVFLQMSPVITLILGFLLLNEGVTARQLLGFCLIIVATVGVSRDAGPHEGKALTADLLRFPASFRLMIAACTIWAVSAVLSDGVLDRIVVDIRTLAISVAYAGAGYVIGGAMLYIAVPRIRHAFNTHLATATRYTFGAVTLLEIVFLGRQLAYFMAISLGPVALVSVLMGTSVFFGILLGWVLTLLLPTIFHEDIQRSTLLLKGLWAVMLFAGLALIG